MTTTNNTLTTNTIAIANSIKLNSTKATLIDFISKELAGNIPTAYTELKDIIKSLRNGTVPTGFTVKDNSEVSAIQKEFIESLTDKLLDIKNWIPSKFKSMDVVYYDMIVNLDKASATNLANDLYGILTTHKEMPKQALVGMPINRSQLQYGDLIFFDTSKKRTGKVTHVGIYVGDNKFEHAASTKKGVIISSLDKPYYKSRVLSYRRYLPSTYRYNQYSSYRH